MVQYRRNKIKGGTYFFTVNLHDRKANTLIEQYTTLRSAIKKVKISHPFTINAFVILPNHLHMIWTLPCNDDNYSLRWQLIKRYFTRSIPKNTMPNEIWQPKFWEHTIRDQTDFENHVNYIHYNPIKHGYVNELLNWQYSSFLYFVKQSILPIDWCGSKESLASFRYGE